MSRAAPLSCSLDGRFAEAFALLLEPCGEPVYGLGNVYKGGFKRQASCRRQRSVQDAHPACRGVDDEGFSALIELFSPIGQKVERLISRGIPLHFFKRALVRQRDVAW